MTVLRSTPGAQVLLPRHVWAMFLAAMGLAAVLLVWKSPGKSLKRDEMAIDLESHSRSAGRAWISVQQVGRTQGV